MKQETQEHQEHRAGKRMTAAGYIFLGLSWGMVACIVLQTFFAGTALFTDSAYWAYHTNFVHIFEFLPLLMLIVAFLGKLPKSLRWQSLLVFVVIYSQYFTANLPGAGAYHPVIALVLFWLSIRLASRVKGELLK